MEKAYQNIIKDNELLLGLDFVKSSLSDAYNCKTEDEMKGQINIIIDYCEATNNKHFKWFARLLKNHLEGICNYASYQITTGKVEGTNNMIKTLRRRHYGIPDDDYLFLKIMDDHGRVKKVIPLKYLLSHFSLIHKIESSSFNTSFIIMYMLPESFKRIYFVICHRQICISYTDI